MEVDYKNFHGDSGGNQLPRKLVEDGKTSMEARAEFFDSFHGSLAEVTSMEVGWTQYTSMEARSMTYMEVSVDDFHGSDVNHCGLPWKLPHAIPKSFHGSP